MTIKIYHNPRCSKSRQTLELLNENGVNAEIVEYLKTPLSASDIETLAKLLSVASVRDMMRTKEDIYKSLNLKDVSDETTLINAMVENPKLIERPIVVNKNKAAIGRPPENVLAII